MPDRLNSVDSPYCGPFMGHQMFMYSKNLKEHWPEASANPIHDNWLAQTGTQMQRSLYNPCGKLTECRSEHHITKSRLAQIRPTHMNPNSHFQVLAVTRSASPHAPKSDLRLHAEPGPTHQSGGSGSREPCCNLEYIRGIFGRLRENLRFPLFSNGLEPPKRPNGPPDLHLDH